jgi:hypothetical protein
VHLQLPIPWLYKSGRIREDILQKLIAGTSNYSTEWKRLLNKKNITVNEPRIGQLRKLWKEIITGPGQ